MSKVKKETGRKMGILQMCILACGGGLVGGVGSWVFFSNREFLHNAIKQLTGGISQYGGHALAVVAVISSVLSISFALFSDRKYKKWDQENEEYAEKLEDSLHIYQSALSFLSTFCVCISGLVLSQRHRSEIEKIDFPIIIFMISAVIWLICLDKIIKCEKKLNPEKRGNALSWSFNKEWLASCDEREKIRFYEAAYHTYQQSNYIYLGVFVLLLLISTATDIGVFPFLILTVIWCSQILLYLYHYQHKN